MEGRISRSTYWLKFFLPVFVISIILGVITGAMGASDPNSGGAGGILLIIWQLAIIYPAICMQGKRWHDRDKSAWWILINFVPVIGGIWALVECGFLKGTEGPNQYGEDPVPAA